MLRNVSRITCTAMVVAALVFGLTSGTFAGGGAGEGGPEGQEPGSPSLIGQLKMSVSKDGNSLLAEFTGQCGPLGSDPGQTSKVNVPLPVPGDITVLDFENATAAQIATKLDREVIEFSAPVPAAIGPCLDIPFTQPIFVMYPNRVLLKNNGALVADVVLLNWVPIATP